MAAEPLTLEELIERATSINNRGSNEEAAKRVAGQVNQTIGGPNSAVKCIIQRLQLHQEVITLQTLTVVEICVKLCGVKFHNEIGRYKFINELIKLLSPKYDGDITPPTVKERVIELMFSWYCGLPQEKKIAEAYRMLKQQGIIKHDPVDTEQQNMPSFKDQKSVIEDDDSSKLLATLLASNDPEDLHSANKLIKSMVKQEEDRLDRVSKRVQDLETVSNNVKLLDEMLLKFQSSTTGHEDLEIMHDLYESCLKLRPELFRLASQSADDKDDSMAEILSASDELTRVIDLYKEKILLQKVSSITKPYNISDSSTTANDSSLLDLGFGDKQQDTTSNESTTTGNSLLDEQFKLLGLDGPEPSKQQPPIHNVGLVNDLSQTTWQKQPQMNYTRQPMMGGMQQMHQTPMSMQTSQQLIGAMRPMPHTSNPVKMTPQPTMTSNKGTTVAPTKKTDLLDFDVFSEFRTPTLMTSSKSDKQPDDKVDGANQSALDTMLDISNELNKRPALVDSTPSLLDQAPSKVDNAMSLIDTSSPPVPVEPPKSVSPPPMHQEAYAVPLEALRPADYPPTLVYEKNGLKTLLHIAQDTRDTANTNVIATILSTISTSTSHVTDFGLQVAVPKAMRVKLQAATSTELKPYNPIFPPPSVSQVMLIANPSKETVRLRFKITYKMNGAPYTETASIDQIPVT